MIFVGSLIFDGCRWFSLGSHWHLGQRLTSLIIIIIVIIIIIIITIVIIAMMMLMMLMGGDDFRWVVVGSLAALMLIGLLSVAAWQFRFALASTVRVGSPVALIVVGLFSVRSLPTIIITWNPQPLPFERRHPMRSPTLEFWVRQPLATPLVLDF